MSELKLKREIMDSAAIERSLNRIALEIVEQNEGTERLALVGIHTGGVPLAHRLQERIAQSGGGDVKVGMIDITLYRDDVFTGLLHPIVGETKLPFRVTEQRLVLVDDVLFTGRTIRSALDALIDFGRPRCIQLAVLVDRGRREFPIQPDYVGITVQTDADESVQVALVELGAAADRAFIQTRMASEGSA
jgi:pyrimidine operon attenuation protein/uracil phosphoribosyltransferase